MHESFEVELMQSELIVKDLINQIKQRYIGKNSSQRRNSYTIVRLLFKRTQESLMMHEDIKFYL